jgi:Protein of unknown function (DUF2934)
VEEKTHSPGLRTEVDLETRRKKQLALMVRMVDRKVRSRAKQLYESRGEGEGQELQDWFQAESEVLESNILAKLYRRQEAVSSESEQKQPSSEIAAEQPSSCETV